MAEQTFLKVLLAPCWDHNFPNGPHSWLDNVTAQPSGKVAPYQDNVDSNGRHVGDYYTGRRVANGDKFYRAESQNTDAYLASDAFERWWTPPSLAGRGEHSYFAWDCDPRTFVNAVGSEIGNVNTSIANGGYGSLANALTFTKNRIRLTGPPQRSYSKADSTTVDIRALSGSNLLVNSGGGLSSTDAIPVTAYKPNPSHYQDAVHDAIIQGSFGTEVHPSRVLYPNKPGDRVAAAATAGTESGLTYGAVQPSKAHQRGTKWGGATGTSATNAYTYAYEYTLNVQTLTHSWETISSVMPLPGPQNAYTADFHLDAAQLQNISIDIGSMRETIQIKGILDDSPSGPAQQPTGERWIKRQQLMDIVRSQWAATLPSLQGGNNDSPYNNPNRFAALTIGPMYSSNPYGDQGKAVLYKPEERNVIAENNIWNIDDSNVFGKWSQRQTVPCKSLDMWRYGDEPHDDMRGTSLMVGDNTREYIAEVWDYKPNYKGRRRYRGMIKNLQFILKEGLPDIWEYSFQFEVFKNETVFRRSKEYGDRMDLWSTDFVPTNQDD